MPTIADIRQQYPQYKDLSDDQLASSLHQKFYADMPQEEFNVKIGYVDDATLAEFKKQGFGGSKEDLLKQIKENAETKRRNGVVGDMLKSLVSVPIGMAASIPAGLAGLAQGAKNLIPGMEGMPAGDRVKQVQSALQPFEQNQFTGKDPVSLLGRGVAKVGEAVGNKVLDVTGSPAAATAVDLLTQSVPGVFLKGKGVPAITEAPEAAAKSYVERHTSLAWDQLSDEFKGRLQNIAKDAKALDKLDPKAVERQGKLASLDKPITNATKGQLTREPLQQRTEQLVKATESGKELREIDLEQNKALMENLDVLKGKVRGEGKAEGSLQTGQSVQGALRERAKALRKDYNTAYKKAEESGALAEPVDVSTLKQWLENPTNKRNAPDLAKAIADYEKDGKVSINDLEQIRQEATAAMKGRDKSAHYAGEATKVIDQILDNSGNAAYKEARGKFKAYKDEFDRQGAVKKLVTERGMSQDRAVALEDTWHKTVLNGSLEDLQKVRKSLEASPKGKAAWGDLRAATVDYLKEKATGGQLGLKNESGDLNATWGSLKRAVDDIDPDKMKEILGDANAKKVTDIVEAAQILKTEAPTGVKGSPTLDKLMTMLDRIGNVPGLGKVSEVAGGVVKGAQKISEMGKTGREIRAAKRSPLEEAEKDVAKKQRKKNTLKSLEPTAPIAPLTLQNQEQRP